MSLRNISRLATVLCCLTLSLSSVYASWPNGDGWEKVQQSKKWLSSGSGDNEPNSTFGAESDAKKLRTKGLDTTTAKNDPGVESELKKLREKDSDDEVDWSKVVVKKEKGSGSEDDGSGPMDLEEPEDSDEVIVKIEKDLESEEAPVLKMFTLKSIKENLHLINAGKGASNCLGCSVEFYKRARSQQVSPGSATDEEPQGFNFFELSNTNTGVMADKEKERALGNDLTIIEIDGSEIKETISIDGCDRIVFDKCQLKNLRNSLSKIPFYNVQGGVYQTGIIYLNHR